MPYFALPNPASTRLLTSLATVRADGRGWEARAIPRTLHGTFWPITLVTRPRQTNRTPAAHVRSEW